MDVLSPVQVDFHETNLNPELPARREFKELTARLKICEPPEGLITLSSPPVKKKSGKFQTQICRHQEERLRQETVPLHPSQLAVN